MLRRRDGKDVARDAADPAQDTSSITVSKGVRMVEERRTYSGRASAM